MNKAEKLAQRYGEHIATPWQTTVSSAERTIFLVYDRDEDRRIRAQINAIVAATKGAGKDWLLHDFTDFFPAWLQGQKYRDAYFEDPDALQVKLESAFAKDAADNLKSVLKSIPAGKPTVVGVLGIACLFGLVKFSSVLSAAADSVPDHCRLLVLFPGKYENHRYNLLDGRADWNYMAVPITLREDNS